MLQDDHDSVPDEFQREESHEHEEEGYDAGQTPGVPPMRPGTPVREAPFTPQPAKPVAKEAMPEKKPIKPEKLNWESLDLSHGPIKKGLWEKRPQDLRTEVKRGLKDSLGKMLDASQRETVARMIDKERHGGLRSGKLRKDMRAAVKRGEFTKLEAKKILGKLGAKKSSSSFL